MFGKYEHHRWENDGSTYSPKKYRMPCDYDAFIPNELTALPSDVPAGVGAAIAEAEQEAQRVDAGAQDQPAYRALARLLLRSEAIASSKIEGLALSAQDYAKAELKAESGGQVGTVSREVIGNVAAMEFAIANVVEQDSISGENIAQIHGELLKGSHPHLAGDYRDVQNWIGGNNYNPCGADFIPPPPEYVEPLISDLCAFSNSFEWPAVAQAAIAHAQFETIHPFADGNGRTGRALIHVILRRREISQFFVPPISVVLSANPRRYIDGLTEYREGDIYGWVQHFSETVAHAATLARKFGSDVRDLQQQWRDSLKEEGIRSDAVAWKIIELLPAYPVISTPVLVAAVGAERVPVFRAVETLERLGILEPANESKRYRLWEPTGLSALIAILESALRGN